MGTMWATAPACMDDGNQFMGVVDLPKGAIVKLKPGINKANKYALETADRGQAS